MPTSQPRSIVIIAPVPPPYGGMALQAKALAERLSGEAVPVVLVATNPRLSAWLAAIPGLRTALQSGYYLVSLLRALPRGAIIHIFAASYFYFWARVLPAVLLGRLCGKRVVLNYRGGEAERFLAAYGLIAVPLLRIASVITVPSSFLRRIFKKYDLSTVTVPNLLDLTRFHYRRRGALRPRLLVTRSLEPMYNVGMALRAYEMICLKYPDASLDLLGTGSEEQSLIASVGEKGLTGIRFHGAVAHERVPEYLDHADILLNPTNVDNMPLNLLEAFASGVAVVTTNAGGIPDLLGESEAALVVQPDDAEQMASKVMQLLEDPALADRMTTAGRRLAENYDWKAVRTSLLQAYYAGAVRRETMQEMEINR